MKQLKSLLKIRKAELNVIHKKIGTHNKVLEIGGGNGYQALLISKKNRFVKSIDIKTNKKSYFPVRKYNGHKLPFKQNSFDIVFTSHVLEHLTNLKNTLYEINRVLKTDGLCIHILPSSTWRIYTSFNHYVFIILKIAKILSRREQIKNRQLQISSQKSIFKYIKTLLWPSAHGEYSSWLMEVWYFSKKRWSDEFLRNNFQVQECRPSNLFYTGYSTMPNLPLKVRKRLSFFLGSSSFIFVLKKRQK